MSEPADNAGVFARQVSFPPPVSSSMSARLTAMLQTQIGLLEAEPVDPGFNEDRVKALLTLAKAVQAVEGLPVSLQEDGKGNFHEPEDILEFRRQLEKKIEALGDGRSDRKFPGQAQPE